MAEENIFDKGLSKPVTNILNAYRKALFSEMYFLRDSGGRKYKVSNGKRLGKSGVGFAYSFDLESELFLSEDAPITVSYEGSDIKGNILACEDFQVIAVLDTDIGKKVARATINVAPWKLLEALNEYLSHISVEENPIAIKLIEEGPKLKTAKPIDFVSTGQKNAIKHALNNPITIIWGPPGTGKTHTMAEIAIKYMEQGKSVLCVSHSNISVDGVISRVAELAKSQGKNKLLSKGKVLRFGHVRDESLLANYEIVAHNYALKQKPGQLEKLSSLYEERDALRKSGNFNSTRRVELENAIKKIKKSVSEDEKTYVSEARLVATTVSRLYANKLFKDKKYDMVLFDEISMAYVPQVVCAAMFARERLVCVGDFRQLAPIAQGPQSKKALSRDLFWYLGVCSESQQAFYHPWLVMLNEQRRMHPSISAFPSKTFYSGLLKDHESVIHGRDKIANGEPYPGSAVNLIDLSGTYCRADKNNDNSRFNVLSAAVAFAVAISAEKAGERNIGIIAPYVAQVRLIRAMLEDLRLRKRETEISCATVHQFQGSERNLIVIDTVESSPYKKPGILTFNNENGSVNRLVNVAVSRSRGKLVTVSDCRFWDKSVSSNAFKSLIEYQVTEDNYVNLKNKTLISFLRELDFGPNINLYLDIEKANELLIKDINRARQNISISIPDGCLIFPHNSLTYQALKEAKLRGVEILLKCANWNELPEDWKDLGWQSNDAHTPLMIIDGLTAWYGMPLSRGKGYFSKDVGFRTNLQTPLRIKGERTIEMIASLVDINSKVVDGKKQALKPKTGSYIQNEKGEGITGLSLYVSQNLKCKKCHSALKMQKGFKSGKFFLKCSSCDETALLTKEFVNHYICDKQVKCPKCLKSLRSGLTARVSKYGLYIKCDRGHTVKPDEI